MSSPINDLPTGELLNISTITQKVDTNIKMAFQQVRLTNGWNQLLSTIVSVLMAQSQSGTTANRPTKGLFTGRVYFDTTLGKPIWFKTAGWIDATGSGV